jgi:hypothetical protein
MATKKPATHIEKKISALVKDDRLDDTISFAELPPQDKYEDSKSKTRLHAADLFSLFTADIIKEDVIFTR